MIQIGSLTKILPVKRGSINFVLDEQKTKFKQKRRNFTILNKSDHFILPTPSIAFIFEHSGGASQGNTFHRSPRPPNSVYFRAVHDGRSGGGVTFRSRHSPGKGLLKDVIFTSRRICLISETGLRWGCAGTGLGLR